MYYEIQNKIVRMYQTYNKSEHPNKLLLDSLLEAYAAGYEQGMHDEKDRTHWFHEDMIEKEKLLQQCHDNFIEEVIEDNKEEEPSPFEPVESITLSEEPKNPHQDTFDLLQALAEKHKKQG